jgi:hypothetical protein
VVELKEQKVVVQARSVVLTYSKLPAAPQ